MLPFQKLILTIQKWTLPIQIISGLAYK